MKAKSNIKTICVHEGELKDKRYKGVVSPLYLSSAYAFDGVDEKRYLGILYPNQEALALSLN